MIGDGKMPEMQISPVDTDVLLNCGDIQNWMHSSNYSILWVSGPCGTGKACLVKSLLTSLKGFEQNRILWISFKEIADIHELKSILSGELITEQSRYMVLNKPELLSGAFEYLRCNGIVSLPLHIKIIVISRHCPFGNWIHPIWQHTIRHLSIRPLGIIEAVQVLGAGLKAHSLSVFI